MSDRDDDDWHLQEWLAHFGKRQADMVKDLGWTKNRAHFVWHSTQPYRRGEVNEIARWLGIKPYELLMAPLDALALRQLRETAAVIAAIERPSTVQPAASDKIPDRPKRTGTH